MNDEQREKWSMLATTGKAVGKYRIEYCPMLIDHMGGGLSYESFARVVGVSMAALKNWETLHPEWVMARAEGNAARLYYWENVALGHVTGTIKANPAALIFALKNAFPEQYKDKQELDVKGYSNTVRIVDTGIVRNVENAKPHTIEMSKEEEDVDL